MQDTTKAIQEFVQVFKVYWYFSFIYIWWIATTLLHFKDKKSWQENEALPFNWIAYLIVLVALFSLFFGNRAMFNAFFEVIGRMLLVVFLFIAELGPTITDWIDKIIDPKSGQPVIIKIIVFIIGLIMVLAVIGLFLLILYGLLYVSVIGGILYVVWWLVNDLRKKWFSWFQFKLQHSIPLLCLFFYPATCFTLNFMVESLTCHPLEGTLTVKAKRRTWVFIIGLLILLTGIIGKVLR